MRPYKMVDEVRIRTRRW